MLKNKCSLRDQKLIEEQVENLKEHDLIEDSTSPFAAPVMLVDNKEADESGKDNLGADDLSRNPVLDVSDQQDDGVKKVANLITLDEIRSANRRIGPIGEQGEDQKGEKRDRKERPEVQAHEQ